MMNHFDAHEGETIESFINKYPLTVSYFQDRGLGEEGLSMKLGNFRIRNDLGPGEFEQELQHHMAKAVVPDHENCLTLCLTETMCGKKITAAVLVTGVLCVAGLWWLL